MRQKPEPALFLCSVGIGFNVVLVHAFIVYRLCCVNHGQEFPNVTCPSDCWQQSINSSKADLIKVEASHFGIYGQITATIPAVMSSYYFAVWSDTFGRKLPLLVSSFGISLNSILYVILSTYQELPLGIVLVSNVLIGCTGLYLVFFTSCFAMIIDMAINDDLVTIEIGLTEVLL